MILRKPFAMLIRHFKLIHFIMLGLMFYVTYNTTLVFTFLNEYISSTLTLITHETYLTLFNTSTFVAFALIFVINIIVLGLMAFKKKPIKVYIFNLVAYIYILITFIVAKNIISTLEISLIEIRTIKLIQDLLFGALIAEIITLIFASIRATGFDIKSFNFANDLEEFEIAEEDNEEFEVDLDIDTDDLKRKTNRGFRYFRYIYVENKYVFSVLILVIISFVCGLIYLNMTVYNRTYKENISFQTSEFILNIENSYITKYDYRGNLIDENYSFVVIKMKMRTLGNIKKVFKTGKFALNINDHNLYPTKDYMTEFKDLGKYYDNNDISNEFKTYILIYKIPNSYEDDKMLVKYYDNFFKSVKAKISPINLNKKYNAENYNVVETIELENSVLKDSNIKISSYEISNNFKAEYEFCLRGNCKPSYEYIKPVLNTNYDKTLLKLEGEFNLDDELSMLKIPNLYEFIKEFGSVSYVINGSKKTFKEQMLEVLPTKFINKKITYLELPREIENASEIYLHFNVRNREYIYKLR